MIPAIPTPGHGASPRSPQSRPCRRARGGPPDLPPAPPLPPAPRRPIRAASAPPSRPAPAEPTNRDGPRCSQPMAAVPAPRALRALGARFRPWRRPEGDVAERGAMVSAGPARPCRAGTGPSTLPWLSAAWHGPQRRHLARAAPTEVAYAISRGPRERSCLRALVGVARGGFASGVWWQDKKPGLWLCGASEDGARSVRRCACLSRFPGVISVLRDVMVVLGDVMLRAVP